MIDRRVVAAVVLLALGVTAGAALARADDVSDTGEHLVSLDFNDAELSDVIETIARMTNRNFIYDDRVRGRVTIISPTPIPVDQAYAVFESVLQVKGFTTVKTPGGALKIIPMREAKETSVETVRSNRRPPDRDRFVTRLIPLQYIEAEPIVNTLKPLVSKDAAMAAYAPTNTVILTESASNIRRIMAILEAIDVDTHRDEIAVIHVEYAEANVLASQLTEIFGAESQRPTRTSSGRSRRRSTRTPEASAGDVGFGDVRLITDERTNSLIAMSAPARLDEVRELVRRLDVPITGGGRIRVYNVQYADAEELAQTLNALISGAPAPAAAGGAGGGQAQAIRTAVTALAEGISLTADPATNSLVIQARKEGYDALVDVIKLLDIERPQVLVEALILEADVTDSNDLGFDAIYRLMTDKLDVTIESLSDAAARGLVSGAGASVGLPPTGSGLADSFVGQFFSSGLGDGSGSSIQGIIRANATDNGINIVSAPHVLTSDNEEAEIRIGDNIPIITSRVQSAAGLQTGLSTSVNVERQDIGVTLRVTPQITEGDSLRLDIFQEITAVNTALNVGNPEDVGVPLSSRRIENTVVVKDGDTVVIGGLISDVYEDDVSKVPFLGDIPILGWAFKTKTRKLQKINLLVFLTPHIVRSPEDIEFESVRKREEFAIRSGSAYEISPEQQQQEEQRWKESEESGAFYEPPHKGKNPVRNRLLELAGKHPLERMREIEQERSEAAERKRAEEEAAKHAPRYMLETSLGSDEQAATELLVELVDAGYEGNLVSRNVGGTLLHDVRVGPYATIDEARDAAETIRRAYDVKPEVVVVPPEEP